MTRIITRTYQATDADELIELMSAAETLNLAYEATRDIYSVRDADGRMERREVQWYLDITVSDDEEE